MATRTLNLRQLGAREREIVEVLFGMNRLASVAEVRERLQDPPTYSTVRAMLSKLEQKGFVRHEEKNLRYVYAPTAPRAQVRESALSRLVEVFFGGNAADAAIALLDESEELSEEDLKHLEKKIAEARRLEQRERT